MFKRVGAALLAACVVSSPALADVTVGVEDGGNQLPFLDGELWTYYQQLYDGSAFGGPVVIEALTFFEAADRGSSTTSGGTFTLNFYLTSKTSGTLTADAAANKGALLASFGAFTLPYSIPGSPGSFTLDGADFTYDPSKGNLLLEVSVTGGSSARGLLAFDGDSPLMARLTKLSPAYGGSSAKDGGGLVTRFTTSAVAAPEPATWALMIAGFGLAGTALRRREARA